jgi:hypothetical protein
MTIKDFLFEKDLSKRHVYGETSNNNAIQKFQNYNAITAILKSDFVSDV